MQTCYDYNIAHEGMDCPVCILEADVERRWRRFCMGLEEIIYRGGVDPTSQEAVIELLDETLMVEK